MTKEKVKKILKVVWYSLCGLLAAVQIMSAYGGMVSPYFSTLPAILAMTFPFWLGLSIVVGVISLFILRRAALIQGIAILVSLGPVLSYTPLNFFPRKLSPQEKERSFTLLSYNCFGLRDYRNGVVPTAPPELNPDGTEKLNPTMMHVLRQNADIVCLQEFYINLPSVYNPLGTTLRDSIIDRYPYRITGTEGAILSKYPLYKVPIRHESPDYEYAIAAVANIQGHRTLIVSVHLESIGLDSSDRELYRELTSGEGGKDAIREVKTRLLGKLSNAFRNRANQARNIRNQIDSIGIENVIITGDFNDIPDCYAMRELSGDDFKSAFAMAGCGPMITYHASHFYFHIDHTLYRGNMDAVNFRRDNFDRSDHYPIMSRFLWIKEVPGAASLRKGIDLRPDTLRKPAAK